MAHALIDTVVVDFDCGPGALLRANGSTLVEKGFMVLYTEGKDDQNKARQVTPLTENYPSCRQVMWQRC